MQLDKYLETLGMKVLDVTRRVIPGVGPTTCIKLNPNGVKDTGSYALNALVFGDIYGDIGLTGRP